MRITKTVNGEPFRFRVFQIIGTMTCRVKAPMNDEWKICDISEDFKSLTFADGEEEIFHFGKTSKKVKKLTIPKHMREDFEEGSKIIKNQ